MRAQRPGRQKDANINAQMDTIRDDNASKPDEGVREFKVRDREVKRVGEVGVQIARDVQVASVDQSTRNQGHPRCNRWTHKIQSTYIEKDMKKKFKVRTSARSQRH